MKQNLTTPPFYSSLTFYKANALFLFLGIGSLVLGFSMMSLDKQEYGYGLLGLTIGPLCVLTGFCILGLSILYRSKEEKEALGKQEMLSGPLLSWQNGLGGCVFAISLCVYCLTAERTVSLWDCGEFISAAYKLQIPHPPGTPLFLLIGRFFSLFAADTTRVAYCVNLVSAFASSFTVLVLYHTILLIGKRFWNTSENNSTLLVVAATIGSLGFAFTDSFWFNATEAEVYALSCLFTALVFWTMLKWRDQSNWQEESRWLLLLSYLFGLSVGVHLLNLLALPALAFLFYAKKYSVTWKGSLLALGIGCGLLLLFMEGLVIGIPSLAAFVERVLVNSLHFPFGSGVWLFFIIVASTIAYGLFYTHKKKKQMAHFTILLTVFAFLGSSSNLIIPIRSAYNPPLDENDPQDVMNLMSYLKRDQYGTHPLLIGPHFMAGYPNEILKQSPIYRQNKEKGTYEICDYQYGYEYEPKNTMLFPRMYSTEAPHAKAYRAWTGLREGEKPKMKDNLTFLFKCQLGHMYWRYFFWNFVGRESDIQDAGARTPFSWWEEVPEVLRHNKARNNYFMLPFLLGLIGAYFHFKQRKQDAWSLLFLFFFSGMAIVLYLNPPPVEPRERDYTYVGTFYAFSIWMGIGVLFLADQLRRWISSSKMLIASATLLCFPVPLLLFYQNWDYHNRKGRYFAADMAKNMLTQCEKNAILFVAADNDTFPLWYIQEVEGYRTDVRICNLSLLNMEWYVRSMKEISNLSIPLPISLEEPHFRRGKNDMVYLSENPNLKAGISLPEYLTLLKNESKALTSITSNGDEVSILPSKKLFLPVLSSEVGNGAFTSQMEFELHCNLSKSELVVLDIIAHNHWERPLYFDVSALGEYPYLKKYLVKEGLVYRLMPFVPLASGEERFDSRKMYEGLVQKSLWRGLNDSRVYIDPASAPFIAGSRIAFYELAVQFYNENNLEKAKEVLLFSLQKMPDATIPYDHTLLPYMELLGLLKQGELASSIGELLGKRSIQNADYFSRKKDKKNPEFHYSLYVLQQLSPLMKRVGKEKLAQLYGEKVEKYGNYNDR